MKRQDKIYGEYAPPARPTFWAAFLLATVLSLGFLGLWAIVSLIW